MAHRRPAPARLRVDLQAVLADRQAASAIVHRSSAARPLTSHISSPGCGSDRPLVRGTGGMTLYEFIALYRDDIEPRATQARSIVSMCV